MMCRKNYSTELYFDAVTQSEFYRVIINMRWPVCKESVLMELGSKLVMVADNISLLTVDMLISLMVTDFVVYF